MSILDEALKHTDNGLLNTDKTFIDADTLRGPDNTRYRIQGINAPETDKILGGKFKEGTAGGAVATETVKNLANSQGFTDVRPILDEDGKPKMDPFGRQLVDLINPETGESFKQRALATGVFGTTKYTNSEDNLTAIFGQAERDTGTLDGTHKETNWDRARKEIEAGIRADGGKQLGFKRAALDEAELAAAKRFNVGRFYDQTTVQHRDYGRSLKNESNNPFSDSWEQGWIGVKESAYGMLNLLGETTGIQTLAEIGEFGVERARSELAHDYGTTLVDYKDVIATNDDGSIKLSKSFGNALSYLTNNAALSLPYMAITVGGTLAAPITGGASLAAPASVYAGQTWNEQEGKNKNAGIAIASGVAQAALDRLGLGFLVRKGVGSTGLLNEALKHLKTKGYSDKAANELLAKATRKEIAGFAGDVAKIAKGQLAGKEIFKGLIKKASIGASGEGITEALQEATGYTAAHWTGEGFDFNELNERMLAGFIAGTALGGAFTVPGSAYEAGAWADLAFRQAPADAQKLSRAGKNADAEIKKHGRIKSIEELNEETASRAASTAPNAIPTLDERRQLHKSGQKGKSVRDQIFDTMVSIPALWRGATRNIFTDNIIDNSRAARVLADMFGGQLQKTFSGSTYENAKHHKVSIYKNSVAQPEKIFSALNGGKRANRFKRGEISNQIYSKLRKAIDPKTKKFNPDAIPDTDPDKQLLIKLQNQLETLGQTLHNDQSKHNTKLGKIDNYLLRYKSLSKKQIVNNKAGFVAALKAEFGFDDVKANEIADSITNSTEVNDISDALDATQAAVNPGSHKRRSLDLADKDSFKEFMEQDLFANVAAASKSAARYSAQQEYLGKNNANISRLLQDMQDEGIAPATVNKVADQLNNYFLAESGNYKRPTSAAGKKLQVIQRNFMMFTTLAGLPLATISSFVEAALTFKGLTIDQIFGKGKALENMGRELGHTLWTGMKEVSSTIDKKQVVPAATKGKEAIQNLGFYDWDVGAATVTGATEVNPWQQQVYEQFFKWTGLSGWTNFTRAARASIAGDYITDKIQIIFDNQGSDKTNEVQEAEESLRNIGINVQDVLEAYRGGGTFDPNAAVVLEKNFREGMFNFVNDAVALPQAANRPLIYQDPRFALFTQFQGFIATFTANHIPKLWGEYVKRGSPAMKYNAFATMTTMIMLGFASQYLKDLIKYGQYREFGPDEHPFLNTSEYAQRGIRASGLLGTGERVLDQFFPLYDDSSKDVGEWLWNTTSGESPALSYLKKGIKGTGKLLSGDVGAAAKEGSRFLPGLGVLNFFRDGVQETFNSWNFKG